MYMYMYLYIYLSVYVCACVCVFVCVWYTYMYIYIYIYTCIARGPLGTSSPIFLNDNVMTYSDVAELIDLMGFSRFFDNLSALIHSISLLCVIHLRELIITWIQVGYQVSVWRAQLVNYLVCQLNCVVWLVSLQKEQEQQKGQGRGINSKAQRKTVADLVWRRWRERRSRGVEIYACIERNDRPLPHVYRIVEWYKCVYTHKICIYIYRHSYIYISIYRHSYIYIFIHYIYIIYYIYIILYIYVCAQNCTKHVYTWLYSGINSNPMIPGSHLTIFLGPWTRGRGTAQPRWATIHKTFLAYSAPCPASWRHRKNLFRTSLWLNWTVFRKSVWLISKNWLSLNWI